MIPFIRVLAGVGCVNDLGMMAIRRGAAVYVRK